MTEHDAKLPPLTEEEAASLATWQQGDFTLDHRATMVVDVLDADGDLESGAYAAEGLAVINQTCDIVNYGVGKDYVTMCPIVRAGPVLKQDAVKGRTPAAGIIDLAEDDETVVDFGRPMSVHKKLLATFTRRDGFKGEDGRARFQQTLERRFGRFAFPDDFSNGPLAHLREHGRKRHDRDSDVGRAYRSVQDIRAHATPSFEAAEPTVGFFLVVEDDKLETSRAEIIKEFNAIANSTNFKWPPTFKKEQPLFVVQTLDEMSGRDYKESKTVDLDFLSYSKAVEE